MGFDAEWQSIPDDFEMLDKARTDDYFGERLQFIHFGLTEVRWRENHWQANEEARMLAALKMDRPGIDTRYFSDGGTRCWDALHYLLSADRRNSIDWSALDVPDMGTRAVRGSAEIGPLAVATQGIPIRYSNAAQTREIAAALAEINDGDLRAFFDPALMEAAVYKFWADRADERWSSITECFHGLQRVYAVAAEHDEGVLVAID